MKTIYFLVVIAVIAAIISLAAFKIGNIILGAVAVTSLIWTIVWLFHELFFNKYD